MYFDLKSWHYMSEAFCVKTEIDQYFRISFSICPDMRVFFGERHHTSKCIKQLSAYLKLFCALAAFQVKQASFETEAFCYFCDKTQVELHRFLKYKFCKELKFYLFMQ